MEISLAIIYFCADEYAGDALVATVGVHYQVDTIGSANITSK